MARHGRGYPMARNQQPPPRGFLYPVTYDNVGSALNASGTGPFTFSHTMIKAGSLVLAVATDRNVGTCTATVDGVSMTLLGGVVLSSSINGWLFVFGKTGLAVGSRSVAYTFTGSNPISQAGSVSYTNLGSFGTAATTTGATAAMSQTFTGIGAKGVGLQVFGLGGTGVVQPTALSGGTNRLNTINGSDVGLTINDTYVDPTTFNATGQGSAARWGGITVPLNF